MAQNIKDLFTHYPQSGTIAWIGIRPSKKAALQSIVSVLVTDQGLEGDHYSGKSGHRHVTLIQAEHLEAVGAILGKEVTPDLTRRNIMVSGINLLSLIDKQFQIGNEVILQTTGLCQPCSRMEENLGFGGYNAMRGHGGITARVIQGGTISVGAKLQAIIRVDSGNVA
jgi:MOSC domain-containing protein YiiM